MATRFAGDKLSRPEFLAVRDTISFAEGTWDEENNRPGYSYRYGDSPGSGGSLDITAPHPIEARPSPWGGSSGSNASGAYQYLDSTWSEMHDGQNLVMSPANQDRALHRTLTERVGYNFDQPFSEQVHSLAPTWASFPNAQGKSQYNQPVKDAGMLTNHYQQRLDFYRSQLTPSGSTPTPAAPTRPFGSDAVLNGKPVKWGGDNYGWQSPESFKTITPPQPSVQQPQIQSNRGAGRAAFN